MADYSDLRVLYEDQRMTCPEIAKMKGVSSPTIQRHLKLQGIQVRPRNWRRQKYMDLQPSRELSYILPTLMGDGWIQKPGGNGRIQVLTASRDYAEESAQRLKTLGLTPHIAYKPYTDGRKHWCTQAKSIAFCQWWHSMYWFGILDYATAFPDDFVHGVFDAEGSVFQRAQDTNPRIAIDCGNEQLMSATLGILQAFGFSCTTYAKEREGYTTVFRLCLNRADDVERFVQRFPSSVKRL